MTTPISLMKRATKESLKERIKIKSTVVNSAFILLSLKLNKLFRVVLIFTGEQFNGIYKSKYCAYE